MKLGRREIAGIARNMVVDMPRSLMRHFSPDFFLTVEEGTRGVRDMPRYSIRSFFLLEQTRVPAGDRWAVQGAAIEVLLRGVRRIVVFGPPLAGKVSLVTAMAERHGMKLKRSADVVSQDEHRVPNRSYSAGVVGAWELVTMPGGVWDWERAWGQLVSQSDAVVLVLDGQTTRIEDNNKYLGWLQMQTHHAASKGCVILTKQDLASVSPMIDPLGFVRGTRFATWPLVRSSRQNVDAACAAINTLIAG